MSDFGKRFISKWAELELGGVLRFKISRIKVQTVGSLLITLYRKSSNRRDLFDIVLAIIWFLIGNDFLLLYYNIFQNFVKRFEKIVFLYFTSPQIARLCFELNFSILLKDPLNYDFTVCRELLFSSLNHLENIL